ncbi:MAG TPA: cell envelope integrity protein TolA [Candidatus Dojkabacteria bacterium]|nr:cell envelope integrity protein TolA [Candidatus Dojkabacteria bacterium]
MPSSKSSSSKSFKQSPKQILENNFHDESDQFFMLPEVRRLVEQQDREFKELQEQRKADQREIAKLKEQLRKAKEESTARRVKSATEFDKRYKRDAEHAKLLKRSQDLDAEEKHFEEHAKPKAKKIIYNMKKALDRRPEYTCLLLFFARLTPEEEGEGEHFKHMITHHGEKHKQVFASLANVQGNILPFNNKRTFRTDNLEIFNHLLRLVKTDHRIKEFIDTIISGEISCIVVKDAVQGRREQGKPFQPLKKRLFSSAAPQALYSQDISYSLNKEAIKFGELFNMHVDSYVLDNFKANSCYINLIISKWHNDFERRKSDGKRMYKELTYDYVCDIIGLANKNQDLGLSIHQSKKFFEKFRFGLDVLDVFDNMLYTYRPEKLNSAISHQVLRIKVFNNHPYELDQSVKNKIDHIMRPQFVNDNALDTVTSLYVSNKYRLRQPVLDANEIHFIKNLDDCVKNVLNSSEQTEEGKCRFVTNTDMRTMLFDMMFNGVKNYSPES